MPKGFRFCLRASHRSEDCKLSMWKIQCCFSAARLKSRTCWTNSGWTAFGRSGRFRKRQIVVGSRGPDPGTEPGRFHDGKSWVESWRVAIVRPGEDPFGELAEGLCDLNPGMPAGEKAAFLGNRKEGLSTAKEELRSAIASLVPAGPERCWSSINSKSSSPRLQGSMTGQKRQRPKRGELTLIHCFTLPGPRRCGRFTS